MCRSMEGLKGRLACVTYNRLVTAAGQSVLLPQNPDRYAVIISNNTTGVATIGVGFLPSSLIGIVLLPTNPAAGNQGSNPYTLDPETWGAAVENEIMVLPSASGSITVIEIVDMKG